jgi:hypothetical protein
LERTLLDNESGLVSAVTTELNLAALLVTLSTYYLLAASWFATGLPTLESTLVANDKGLVSDVTD